MTAVDPEAEYQAALEAYRAARRRLDVAKKSRPAYAPYQRAARMRERIWQAYLEGERDFKSLARQFGISVGHARSTVKGEMHYRRYGPPTAEEVRLDAVIMDVFNSIRNRNVVSLETARNSKIDGDDITA